MRCLFVFLFSIAFLLSIVNADNYRDVNYFKVGNSIRWTPSDQVTGESGSFSRKGFIFYSLAGFQTQIATTSWGYGYVSGSFIPVGLSFGYCIGRAYFGLGYEVNIGLPDYWTLHCAFADIRIFLLKNSSFSPYFYIRPGVHINRIGHSAGGGFGIEYYFNKKIGFCVEGGVYNFGITFFDDYYDVFTCLGGQTGIVMTLF